MFKEFISLVLLLCYCCACTSTYNVSCEEFKKGKFVLQSDIKPYNSTFIERKDSIQIEISPADNDTTLLLINWVSPCEYELRFLNRNRVLNDSLTSFLDSKIVNCKILKTDKEYYIFKMNIIDINFSYIDTLRVLLK